MCGINSSSAHARTAASGQKRERVKGIHCSVQARRGRMRGATSVSLPFEKDSDCDRPKSAIFTVILSRVGSFSETRIFEGLRSQWTIPAKEGGGQGMGVREDGGLEVAMDDPMVV